MDKIESSNFKILIGNWKTTGTIKASNESLILDGFDSYELILDGNYILHKADVKMGNEKSETLEVISLDGATDNAKMQYFNSRGESGVMTAHISNNKFFIEGNRIKFNGDINYEGTIITGYWYLQAENNDWTSYIVLKLEKTELNI